MSILLFSNFIPLECANIVNLYLLFLYLFVSIHVNYNNNKNDIVSLIHFFSCSSNPECGWCQTDGICYLRTDAAKCTSNLKTVKCPGLCEALPNCQSCAQHGKRYRAKESVSKVIDILRLLEHFRQNLPLKKYMQHNQTVHVLLD